MASVLSVVAMSVATWLDLAAARPRAHDLGYLTAQWVTTLTVLVLGVRVVQARVRHPIGWVLIAMGTIDGITAFTEIWAWLGLVSRPGSRPGAVAADAVTTGSWVVPFAGAGFLLLYFPDGRLPSVRWRRVPMLLGLSALGAWFAGSVKPGRQAAPFNHLINPVGLGWTHRWPGIVPFALCFAAMLGCLVVAAISVRVRFRRAAGEERAQLFWIAWSGILVPGALTACILGQLITGTTVLGDVALPIAVVLVTSSIALAVLRYRLYDIEYLVGRTITYAASTLTVFSVFAGIVLGLGVLAGGRRSPSVVAAATLAGVVVARPARDRVQRWVNRRFDRDVAEGVAMIDAFEAAARSGAAMASEIEAVLARALHEPGLHLILDVHDGRVPAASATEVRRGEHVVARIEHSAKLNDRPRLRDAVVARAVLSIELARLAAENAAHLAKVEASRERIVEATHEERRRLERDLHDGAQQRLVALGVRLRRLQRALPAPAETVGGGIDQAVNEISETITELRRIAAGVRPPRLDDGLGAALEDLARTSPIPIDLDVDGRRLPELVETSAYFVACEAVTNAVKHSKATRIHLALRRNGTTVAVSVRDDGVGGAEIKPASGLAGLADRVTAVGGTMTIDSRATVGTTVEATLPCAL